jgi:hypothetical protein
MPRDKDLITKRNAEIRRKFEEGNADGRRSGWLYERLGEEYFIRPETVAEIVSGRERKPKAPFVDPRQKDMFS